MSQDSTLIEQLKQQLANFTAQRDQVAINLQQLVGAIYACEMMIKKHHEDEESAQAASKLLDDDKKGNENGDTNNQEPEQPPQE